MTDRINLEQLTRPVSVTDLRTAALLLRGLVPRLKQGVHEGRLNRHMPSQAQRVADWLTLLSIHPDGQEQLRGIAVDLREAGLIDAETEASVMRELDYMARKRIGEEAG